MRTAVAKLKRQRLFKRLKKQRLLYLFLLPGVVCFGLFFFYPMYGIIMAFQDFNPVYGFAGSAWVGLDNFRYIFSTPNFLGVLRNTILISLLKLFIGHPMPIIFALMLNEVRHLRAKKIFQTVSYMPHFISWVVAGGLWYTFFSSTGIANHALTALRLVDEPVLFMASTTWIYPIMLFTSIWKGLGFGSIIYLAALAGINTELYEAARVDGASKLRQIWHISLPGIKPTIIILFILSSSDLMKAGFDQMQVLMNPMNRSVANIIDTQVMRMLTSGGLNQLSWGAAFGLFQSVVGMILFILYNLLFRALKEESFI
jgi:putative aldouronate transport system permease protein